MMIFGINMEFNYIVILSFIIQMNDYAGTIDPHVAFNIGNEDTLGFLGCVALYRNSILLFFLTNMMPDTKSNS